MNSVPFLIRLTAAAMCIFLLAACRAGDPVRDAGGTAGTGPDNETVRDIHSYARPERVRVTHAELDWTVDFNAKQIGGAVTWTIERASGAGAEPLILDTRGLAIEEVTTVDGAPVRFDLAEEHPALGAALSIWLPSEEKKVVIRYRTGPDSAALQWLAPMQTAGKKKPYLFSQAQSILARTMVPIQDTPGVRITYTAKVTVPEGLRAVMAAKQLSGGGDGGPFLFEMPQPIPAYLLAIAVGDIDFRPLGPRSGVYAEPSVVDAAAWEFADTERMMTATERLYGPYRWERYDLLVLPPSFPFGGMENPRLTFVTPTILAGDRSLVSLVAHELAHSWSGNLVTNATWSDFWLNESFTVYLHRRILEEVYGEEVAAMDAVLGKQDLLKEMPDLETGFTVLHNVSLEGRDPDNAFSEVPYEKGYLFLRLIEQEVGRERFDMFLREWFDTNAFQSRTTRDFEGALERDLFKGESSLPDKLRVKEWLYAPGLPENAPDPETDVLTRAGNAARSFAAGRMDAAAVPAKGWTTQEWQQFLRALPDDLHASKMAGIDAAWSLTDTSNSEILMEWLLHTIRGGYEPAYPALERFLTGQGRRKFLKPLYTELAKTPEGKERAVAIYDTARPLYHPVSTNTIDKILGYKAR